MCDNLYRQGRIVVDPSTKEHMLIVSVITNKHGNITGAFIRPLHDPWPATSRVTLQQLRRML